MWVWSWLPLSFSMHGMSNLFLAYILHFSMLAHSVLTLVLICLLSCVGSFKVSGLTCYVKPDADTPCPHQPCETLTLCKQCGWFLHNKYVFKGTHLFRINRLLLVGNISGLTLRNWLDDHGNYHMQSYWLWSKCYLNFWQFFNIQIDICLAIIPAHMITMVEMCIFGTNTARVVRLVIFIYIHQFTGIL